MTKILKYHSLCLLQQCLHYNSIVPSTVPCNVTRIASSLQQCTHQSSIVITAVLSPQQFCHHNNIFNTTVSALQQYRQYSHHNIIGTTIVSALQQHHNWSSILCYLNYNISVRTTVTLLQDTFPTPVPHINGIVESLQA